MSVKERVLTAVWIYGLFFFAYTLANRAVDPNSAVNLTIALDQLIPFVPEFIYPFYLLYGFIVLPSFLIRNRVLFYRTAAAFSALILLSVAFFFLFPVVVPRPEFVPDDLAEKLVFSIYRMDPPICGFPSLHVSASLLATLAVYRNSRIQGRIFLVMFLLTSAATLFIKQHVVLDAVGGILMALLVDFLFIREGGFSLLPYLKAVGLMAQTADPPRKASSPGKVLIREGLKVKGTRYDLYEPKGPALRTFIVIHGLTLQGEKDERLMAFSEKLAAAGIRVAAISLPALKDCRFDVSDIGAIGDLAAGLCAEYGGRTGIVGFSFGAGLALVTASRPETRHLIDPLILFGPYYNLKTVFSEIEKRQQRPPVTEADWNNHIWIRLVEVYRHLDQLAVDRDTRKEIDEMLRHYCHEPSLAVKRRFFETSLKHISLTGGKTPPVSDTAADAFSPENKLRHITSRVFLLHDEHDTLIPPHHSRSIYRELGGRDHKGHRLLVTPLLSHVTPRTALKVLDIFPLIGILAQIFEKDPHTADGHDGFKTP